MFKKSYKLYQEHTLLSIPQESCLEILKEFNEILNNKPNPNDKGIYAFYKRMIKYRNYIFNFLYDSNIPPDNNASEQAIRNVKVKQKVSGLFKSTKGAENYAVFRSCIDTTIKQGSKPLAALYSIPLPNRLNSYKYLICIISKICFFFLFGLFITKKNIFRIIIYGV